MSDLTDLTDLDTMVTVVIEVSIIELNPHALKLRSEFETNDPTWTMGTRKFDFQIAKLSKCWQLTLRGEGASEVEEYGLMNSIDCGCHWHHRRYGGMVDRKAYTSTGRAKVFASIYGAPV